MAKLLRTSTSDINLPDVDVPSSTVGTTGGLAGAAARVGQAMFGSLTSGVESDIAAYRVTVGNQEWLVGVDELDSFLTKNKGGYRPRVRPVSASEAAQLDPTFAPDDATPTASGAAKSGPASSGWMSPRAADGHQTREERLAAAIQNVRRADNDASKLGASLAAPLVTRFDAQGNEVPIMVAKLRPWSEAPGAAIISYSENDVLEPAAWGSPERVGRLQHRLVNSGFLTGDFKYGMYDESTQAAYRQLLTFSSYQGISMIDGLVEAHKARVYAAKTGQSWSEVTGMSESAGGSALKPAYQAPDKATVRQTIKQQFRAELGRDPERGELARYAAQYLEDDRADFEGQVREQYGAPEDIPESVFDEAPSLTQTEEGEEGTAGVAQPRIDPVARFQEAFERRTAGERQFKERQTVNASQVNLLGGILGTIDEVA